MDTYKPNAVYKNKYKRSFIDSDAIVGMPTDTKWNADGIQLKPYEFQDPTIVGFNIRFDINRTADLNDYDNLPNSLLLADDDKYSAYSYLMNINEKTRAGYVKQFKSLLLSLQEVTPWYYQTITGLDGLQKIDPEAGCRVGKDAVVSIEMLESIDFRISLLRDLYRKFAWDPIYQRWMLPENMRWFSVQIIISEIRDFHIKEGSLNELPDAMDSQQASGLGSNAFGDAMDQVMRNNTAASKANTAINQGKDIESRYNNLKNPDGSSIQSENKVYATVDNTFLPMHVLYLDMCEFDFLSEGHPYMSSVQSGDYGQEATGKMSFKVGRIKEVSDYTIQNILLDDEGIRTASHKIFTSGDKKVLMRGEHDEKILKHNESNTNFVADRIKAVAGTLASNAINSLVSNLFLGNAFDGNVLDSFLKSQKDRAISALSKQIESMYLAKEKISSEDVKKNIAKTGHAYLKSIYEGESKVELKQGESQTSEDTISHISDDNHSLDDNILTHKDKLIKESSNAIRMPKNIGFDIPDVKIETLSNIGFDEDTPKNLSGNIELKEP